MSNARDKYTDEEWDALEEEAINKRNKAKSQAIKDMKDEIDWNSYNDGFDYSIKKVEEDE